ncbi:GntR family transcriptional regulator [Anaerovorax odorimutans]|uniref:GntR family transcriptional regulator n=1 Tax=Anaerovorax odorimutans TaxID=109327 RepID=A0ABT1RSN7_9FIRM|nr:GntR family transcriptional regulator [Anaerovorax odorimutans]MCQ4638185.1 GntR family transcriptional regulator [Anaerovorax odorimutans]
MKLIINNSSQQPIYEQIVDQIKALIMSGQAEEGEMLPSVRSLSKDLKISALTVKKAYDALEHEGFVNTVHGKGSFIAGTSPELLMEEHRKEVESDLEMAILKGRRCGMTDQEILDLFNLIMEE